MRNAKYTIGRNARASGNSVELTPHVSEKFTCDSFHVCVRMGPEQSFQLEDTEKLWQDQGSP